MKQYLFLGLVALGLNSSMSFAQNNNSYDDDIYGTGNSKNHVTGNSGGNNSNNQNNNNYSNQDNYNNSSYNQSYGSDDYIDYEDDYSYSSQLNRFYNPYYNLGYYSNFYNPSWYDPFYGWNSWIRPGFSMSFGNGPYWNSGWAYSTWYGYNSFSCFSYPYYAGGWGNGYWSGYNNGYYNGYWNGYYDGMYAHQGGHRQVSYAPTYSLNSHRNGTIMPSHAVVGRREALASQNIAATSLFNTQLRGATATRNNNIENGRNLNTINNNTAVRSNANSMPRQIDNVNSVRQQSNQAINNNRHDVVMPDRANNNYSNQQQTQQPSRANDWNNSPREQAAMPVHQNNWNNAPRQNQNANAQEQQPVRQNRIREFFGGNNNNQAQPNRQEMSRPQQQQPRQQEMSRPQPTFSAPRMQQQSAPSAPRMSAPSGGGFSRGGGRR